MPTDISDAVFQPSFPTSSPTSARDILEYWVSPLMFGALFDGVNDDTAAIQAAIDTGRSVEFPQGVAKITGPLIIAGHSGCRYRGSGRGLTTIMQFTDNTPIFQVSGSRMEIDNLKLTWNNVQNSTAANASAFDVKPKGGVQNYILATSHFRSIVITNCAIGFDFGNSIGYSCSFIDIGVESFSIAAVSSDSGTAWTQCYFNAWHVSNQPKPYKQANARGGTASTFQLAATDTAVSDYYVGMIVTFTGSSDQHWITTFDATTKIATFYPSVASPIVVGQQYNITQMAASSKAPMTFIGFTDLLIGMIAFEYLQLSSSTPVVLLFDTCPSVVVGEVRMEGISFRATNSGLVQAAGRSSVVIHGLQSQYSAALTALGCSNLYLARIFYQALIRFAGVFEADHWQVTAAPKWALAAADNPNRRDESPYGGVAFECLLSGDSSLTPVGQDYAIPGPARQTAIVGRPSATLRGASANEPSSTPYNHNLMTSPDIIRFNSPFTANVDFNLDQAQLVAGATVTVIRGSGATGSFSVNIKFGTALLAQLSATNTSWKAYCDGTGYQEIP